MSETEVPTPPRRGILTTTIVAVLLVLVAFGSGFVTGVATDRFVLRRGRGIPPAATTMMARRLDRHLDLTDDQRAKVERILERRHERMNGLWAAIRPQLRQEIDAANAEIAGVLTPEQRQRFEKMKMHLGPGRGGPGGRGHHPPPHP